MRVSILNFGAVGDGKTLCTKSIQSAIDHCSEVGGGIVEFPNGKYLTGTIFFKSNVTLELEVGATILGSTREEDYPVEVHYQRYKNELNKSRCLFFADKCENIGVKGEGKIHGQGEFMLKGTRYEEGVCDHGERPMMFRYYKCKNIKISGVKMEAPGSWTNAFLACDDIWVNGIEIYSWANCNGDGLDFDACNNVLVSNCKLNCSDDCICLQNSFPERKCKDVVVTNCIMSSKWAGMRIGLLSCGDIENLTVSNCTFKNILCSGLKIQSSEGAAVRNMTFTNLVMENVMRPMFITLNQFREKKDTDPVIEKMSVLEDMTFSNIIFKNVDEEFFASEPNQPQCLVIDSIDGGVIRNMNFRDIYHTIIGKPDFTRSTEEIPQHLGIRAEGFNYKEDLPAYGIFARNVEGLTLNNFVSKTIKGDSRPERLFINVK